MTNSEIKLFETISHRHKTSFPKKDIQTIKVKYLHEGNFTKAVAFTSKGLFIGVGKRNPNDTDVPQRGKAIALRNLFLSKPINF